MFHDLQVGTDIIGHGKATRFHGKLKLVREHFFSFFRDIREYKSRVESYSREMLRKEAQIRDMTQRLENGDGSKFILFCIFLGCPAQVVYF